MVDAATIAWGGDDVARLLRAITERYHMGIDPISIAAIGSMAATAAGGGLKAFGSFESGQATQAAMAYQAQVAENHAAIEKRNATMDIQAGEAAANDRGLKTRTQVGTATSHLAAGGIATGVGSAAQDTAGPQAAEGGDLGALGSLLSSAGTVGGQYGQYQKNFAPPSPP